MFNFTASFFPNAPKTLLKKLMGDTYAPFTAKVLASDLTVKFTDDMPEKAVGALIADPITGKAKHMLLSKSLTSSYGMLHCAEHESVHYDQSVNAMTYNMALCFQPVAEPKIKRIKELEAYGRQAYKMTVDFIQGHITKDDLAPEIKYPGPFNMMLKSYLNDPQTKQPMDILLDGVKQQKIILEPQHVLPSFYYYLSNKSQFMSLICDQSIAKQSRQIDLLLQAQNHPDAHAHFNNIKNRNGIKKFYIRNFTLNDANMLLNRDGKDYLGEMDSECLEIFWQNICTFSDEHKTALNHIHAKTEKLIL